jgi:hypothetical protein
LQDGISKSEAHAVYLHPIKSGEQPNTTRTTHDKNEKLSFIFAIFESRIKIKSPVLILANL